MAFSTNDSTSYANTEDYLVESSDFNWKLNFQKENIHGVVTHTVKTINNKAKEMFFDVNNLNFHHVFVDDHEVNYLFIDGALGGKLVVPVDTKKAKFTIKIEYNTTAGCKALQWMTPEMTLGGVHPYMYSQCQAIHARSLFPCQDTPSVKSTYTASVEAPSELQVLMSAVKSESVQSSNVKRHSFHQKIPIPSYLVAIACGDIVGCEVGPRSTVWSEPGIIDAAKWEFEGIEQFISHAEDLCGPYEWGVCDILVMPPTFPYGGMENPCLIFLTPCLLSKDRSQVYVVAHEIAHSWTGNLVTNSSWDHFWVNEGHTNYLERLILERSQGTLEYRHLHISAGLAELAQSLDLFNRCYGPDHEYTKLVPHLEGVDPDDSFSRVPYEKGSFLLFYLESIVGKDQMLKWLKEYIKKFRLKSLSTHQWKAFFLEYMTTKQNVNPSQFDQVEWDRWFYGTGDIPLDPYSMLDRSFIKHCNDLADLWINCGDHSAIEKDLLNRFQGMLPEQKYYFFQVLNDVRKVTLSSSALDIMGRIYGLTSTSNSELLGGWSILCLRSCYKQAVDQVFGFLNSQGRLMYNKPIYKNLYDWNDTRARAIANYEERKHRMHPVTRAEIHKILFPQQTS